MPFKTFIYICLISIFSWSCSEENEVTPQLDLIGQWKYVIMQDMGRTETLIDFRADSSFTLTISQFGLQPNTDPDELNALLVYPGLLNVKEEQIQFNIQEFTYTDYYFQTGPETLENKTVFYDNCTYKINGDTLNLFYTSYPADAPIAAEQNFVRVN